MKNRKLFLLTVILSCVLAAGAVCQAQDVKLAYVDLGKIFDEYGKTKDFDKKLETKYTAYEKEHNDKLQKIKDAQDKLSLMKDEEKAKAQEQIEKDKSDLLEFDRQKQTELRKERDEAVREILMEIEKTIKDYSAEQKFTMVLNDKVLVYVDKTLEITDAIIKKLNEKNAPAPAK